MSPEQVEGKDLTPASDVYAFGLVLYQMVTGTHAFDGSTPLSMAVRRIKENPDPPRTLAPDLDPRSESVILKCLDREPKARFQSGDEWPRHCELKPSPTVRGALRLELSLDRSHSSGASTGNLTVVTPKGTLTSNVPFRVTPQITSFTPASGPVGTSVTITGVSLNQTTAVTFGGVVATEFSVKSNTEVTATVPTGAVTGKINITTPEGTAASTTSLTVSE
jgi:serine/threonine protein kinase